jgi:hypothetical protein
VSWVKNVARQFGCIYARCIGSDKKLVVVRKEHTGDAAGVVLLIACIEAKRFEIKVESI